MLRKILRTNKVALIILIFIFAMCNKGDDFVYYDYYMNGFQKPIGSYKICSSGECYYYVYYRTDGKRHLFVIDDVKKPNTWSFNGKQLILNGDVHKIINFKNDTLFVKDKNGRLFKLLKSGDQE